jgi:hypothetical protein
MLLIESIMKVIWLTIGSHTYLGSQNCKSWEVCLLRMFNLWLMEGFMSNV